MKLNTTNSGHYILPLDDVKGGPENENQVLWWKRCCKTRSLLRRKLPEFTGILDTLQEQ